MLPATATAVLKDATCDGYYSVATVAGCFRDEQSKLSEKVSATISTVVDTICDDGICDSVSDGCAPSPNMFCDGFNKWSIADDFAATIAKLEGVAGLVEAHFHSSILLLDQEYFKNLSQILYFSHLADPAPPSEIQMPRFPLPVSGNELQIFRCPTRRSRTLEG
ncbi:hypothetical protein AXF42_Ash000733 [Apostasia shenzhenica]|uniref:Uncharacterized protein n=1 Tax=Apostasia shenzhenica TaxID=1088818 RepID=A0A2I0AH89_9ASPA|nr:hypothetical protein AXF42_Ash000733 [Apostasia shenzhenica]